MARAPFIDGVPELLFLRLLGRNEMYGYELVIEPSLIKHVIESYEKSMDLIKDPELDKSSLKNKLWIQYKKDTEQFTNKEKVALDLDDAVIKQSLDQLTAPWLRSLIREDPYKYFSTLKIPTLALLEKKTFK